MAWHGRYGRVVLGGTSSAMTTVRLHIAGYTDSDPEEQAELAWRPTVAFSDGLAATVAWYQTHTDWVKRVRSGAYRDFEKNH